MRTKLRSKVTLLFMTCAVLLAIPAIVLADDLRNNLDNTFEPSFEVLALEAGHVPAQTQDVNIVLQAQGGDSEGGCNIGNPTDSEKIEVQAISSNSSAASVKWADTGTDKVTFESCNAPNSKNLTVTAGSTGTANVTFAITGATATSTPGVYTVSSTGSGTYDVRNGQFTVNVTPPPNTPPTVLVTGVTHGATYNKGEVPPAGCSVTDAEDTGESTDPVTDSSALDSDGLGLETVTCSYTDGGGLTETASATYSIVDPSAPTIGYNLNPADPDGDNGWYTGNVSLTWNVTENESPNSLQKTGCDDQNITTDQAETTYSCSATSSGGSAGPESVTIKRDGSAPNAPTTTTNPPNPVANSGGFFKDTVTVSYGGSTDVGPSGVAGYTADQTFNTTGTHDYSGKATDNAGNESTATTGQVKVDADAPTVGITGCPTNPVVLNSNQNITVSASDQANGSGLVSDPSGQVVLDTSSVGSKTKTITVEDKVGHTKSATCNYSVVYNWTGFFSPVDNLPTLNVVKGGSSVPMKFNLGGNQGMSILAAGYPKSISIPCDSTAELDALETVATAGSSGLNFDSTTNQYNYIWKTDKAWTSGCRQVEVKLIDGTSHRANFKFSK